MNGGSNYISIGSNLDSTMLFGNYQNNVDTVKTQMTAMRNAGQTIITFVMWFSDLQSEGFPDPNGFRVSSNGGNLGSQMQSNLIAVLSLAVSLGFTEIHFRFATAGPSSPDNWGGTFNEAVYLQSEQFIMNVRNTVASHSSVPTFFDLSLESVWPQPLWVQYITRLWKTYTSEFGSNDASFSLTCGQRPNLGGQRIQLLVKTFKSQKLPIPAFYLVDCYSNEFAKLQSVAAGMKSSKANRPIYIQECWYNDPATAAQFKKAKRIRGLNIKGIMQWPNTRSDGSGDFPFPFPQDFNKYLPL